MATSSQLRLFIRNVVSPRMRGAGGKYTYRYPVGRLDDEIGQAQGLWETWWITGTGVSPREERDKDRKRNWLSCMLWHIYDFLGQGSSTAAVGGHE
jgi:hypothetical protein